MSEAEITILAPVKLDDLVDPIAMRRENTSEDIQKFILDIDFRVADLDFSVGLIVKLLKEVVPECELKHLRKFIRIIQRRRDELETEAVPNDASREREEAIKKEIDT